MFNKVYDAVEELLGYSLYSNEKQILIDAIARIERKRIMGHTPLGSLGDLRDKLQVLIDQGVTSLSPTEIIDSLGLNCSAKALGKRLAAVNIRSSRVYKDGQQLRAYDLPKAVEMLAQC